MFLSLEIDQKKNPVTFSFTIGSNTVQVGIFGPKSVEQQVRIADSGLQGVRSVQTVLDVLSSSGVPCSWGAQLCQGIHPTQKEQQDQKP